MANLHEVASASVRHKVIANCWNWLHDNFHKLNEPNKIKIITTICSKNVPQEIKGEGFSDKYTFVYMDKKAKDEIASPANRSASELSTK